MRTLERDLKCQQEELISSEEAMKQMQQTLVKKGEQN